MATKPITPEGYARIKERLDHLKKVEEPKIIQEVATAREHGDLRENAEYHAAREKHGMIRAEMAMLEGSLSESEIIDPKKLSGDKVAFGATVKLSNLDNGEEATWRIVGPVEANSDQGTISYESPLARQLIGREVGDEVKVRTPGGVRTFEVLEISFG